MRVEVLPLGVVLDINADETIIQAAWRHGYEWPTVCGGKGTCRTCVLQIDAGADAFGPIGPLEREGLAAVTGALPGNPQSYRLACQASMTGDAVVRKIGVRRR